MMCLTPGSGSRDDGARHSGQRLDRRFGLRPHRLHRPRLGGVDDDGEEDFAVADREPGDRAGLGQRRASVGARNRGKRRHDLVARRHPVTPSRWPRAAEAPVAGPLDREFAGRRKGAAIFLSPCSLSSPAFYFLFCVVEPQNVFFSFLFLLRILNIQGLIGAPAGILLARVPDALSAFVSRWMKGLRGCVMPWKLTRLPIFRKDLLPLAQFLDIR